MQKWGVCFVPSLSPLFLYIMPVCNFCLAWIQPTYTMKISKHIGSFLVLELATAQSNFPINYRLSKLVCWHQLFVELWCCWQEVSVAQWSKWKPAGGSCSLAGSTSELQLWHFQTMLIITVQQKIRLYTLLWHFSSSQIVTLHLQWLLFLEPPKHSTKSFVFWNKVANNATLFAKISVFSLW